MANAKTGYPKFAKKLYELQETMAQDRPVLANRAGFSVADLAAFDTLSAAVTTATAYFPPHVEEG